MNKCWVTSISVELWKKLLDNINNFPYAYKLHTDDRICFYVLGTSEIRGIAIKNIHGLLEFTVIGNVDFFNISDNLSFIKDKLSITKYLKNYDGFANFGQYVECEDVDLIKIYMLTQHDLTINSTSDLKIAKPYNALYKLENTLRDFVHLQLNSVSKNWMKELIPDTNMIKRWEERMIKQNKNKKHSEHIENIISYSDFSDLKILIINKNNWKKCFSNYFDNKEQLQIRLDELQEIRNDVAHSRKISDDNMLLLDIYSSRICAAINRSDA